MNESNPADHLLIRQLRAELSELKEKLQAYEAPGTDTPSGGHLDPATSYELILELSSRIAGLGYAIWDHGLDRDIYVSDELASIYGMGAAEYMERISSLDAYISLVHPEDRDGYAEYEKNLGKYRGEAPFSHDYRIIRYENDVRYVRESAVFFPDESGLRSRTLVVIQDLTEAKSREIKAIENQAALAKVQTLLLQATDLAGLGYCVFDDDSKTYVEVSDGFAGIFGYTAEEFLKDINTLEENLKLIHPADRKKFEDFFLGQTIGTDAQEYRVVRRDGQTRYILETLSPVPGRNYLLVSAQDITARRLAEAQLIQSSKLASLGEMAASIAHEINQPLHVIALAAENIRAALNQGAVQQPWIEAKLERIYAQTQRASKIIDHLRTFARDTSAEEELFDPCDAVIESIDLMREQLRLAGIGIKESFGAREYQVKGSKIRLEQVIVNLLSNAQYAIKQHDDERKDIEIAVDKDPGGFISISCADTGGGVASELIPNIFEPFVTGKPVSEGAGLGLSVSYGIIKEMGGTIEAENSNDGLIVKILLPEASAETDLSL